MRTSRIMRAMKVLGSGAMLLQFGGCDFTTFNEILQTILLGITAAGGIAIIQNI